MDCDDRPAASRPRSPWAVMDGTSREGLAILYSLAATGRCASAAAIARCGHGSGRRGTLDRIRTQLTCPNHTPINTHTHPITRPILLPPATDLTTQTTRLPANPSINTNTS